MRLNILNDFIENSNEGSLTHALLKCSAFILHPLYYSITFINFLCIGTIQIELMPYLNILLSLMLVFFAALQLNDPDPLLWITIYMYAATVTAMSAFRKYITVMIYPGLIFYVVASLYLAPGVIEWIVKEHGENFMAKMQDNKMYIEETRECAGLLICAAIMGLQLRLHRNVRLGVSKQKTGFKK
jgi:hypothetical protein